MPPGLGGVAILSHGGALLTSQLGTPVHWPPESLSAVLFLFPTPLLPPCLAGWNIHVLQAPNFMAEPDEGVDSLHCNHGNTFQRCSPQSS